MEQKGANGAGVVANLSLHVRKLLSSLTAVPCTKFGRKTNTCVMKVLTRCVIMLT